MWGDPLEEAKGLASEGAVRVCDGLGFDLGYLGLVHDALIIFRDRNSGGDTPKD